MRDAIEIVNAHGHNLREVSLRIPHEALVVFSGVSGSGKSTLAFDTIYQEGQRRYLDSLSAYARQFLGESTRAAVDEISGLSPTVSIDQKTVNRNPRSTVGTLTEIYDHLRLWMARLGTAHCPRCGHPVERLTSEQLADDLLRRAPGERAMILGPVVRARKGEYRKELASLAVDGWTKARIDGALRGLDEEISLARYEQHTIEVVVDRLLLREDDRGRLENALDTAFSVGGGVAVVAVEGQPESVLSLQRGCPDHPDISIPELEPRLFSFNTPQGACPACDGLGEIEAFDPDLLVPSGLPPLEGFAAFNEEGRLPFALFDRAALARLLRDLGVSAKLPLRDYPPEARNRLLYGDSTLEVRCEGARDGGPAEVRTTPWPGLVGLVVHIWSWSRNPGLEPFLRRRSCPVCGGARLNELARAVTFRDWPLHTLTAWSISEALTWFRVLTLAPHERDIGQLLLDEIRGRLQFLADVGLDYLSLDRAAATLSGGEAQRIRLAAQVGAGLQGVTYVLDEPSIGLHPRDSARLIRALERLRDQGNTVIVVEHDEDTLRAADFVVDVGPGPGREGGELVAAGDLAAIMAEPRSITGQFLRGEREIGRREIPRPGNGEAITFRGANARNLQGLDLRFPLGCLVAVAGVSGSGKSTLVFEVILPSLSRGQAIGCAAVEGAGAIAEVVEISQAPIGRTPRSNPATYAGFFTAIRDLFAGTAAARARGWSRSRFSFNVKGGRCEACEGAGVKTVEMQFLPTVEVPCEVCGGKRFSEDTLAVRWRGHTIHDVLSLTVREALSVFAHHPSIAKPLQALDDVGLGYLSLGQPSTTLSGGEAQRVKLATALKKTPTRPTLFLLDEPTTGLHWADVERLLFALDRLVDRGHSVWVVEHHLDVLWRADHLIELGPDGGAAGGRLLAAASPAEVARVDTPTGISLARSALPPASPRPWRPREPRVDDAIRVRGARAHNLRSLDVDIPQGRLTVITGPSGSGKTSLAFDTIFAEGQRRYLESLSTYARRFLGRIQRAPVDSVEGLAPAIAVEQRSAGDSPRSTVATVTEVHDVLRLIWARLGEVHCPTCGTTLVGRSPAEAAAWLIAQRPGPGLLLADLEPGISSDTLRSDGWTRLRRGSEILLLNDLPSDFTTQPNDALAIDRLGEGALARAAEAIATAYRYTGGKATFLPNIGDPIVLTEAPVCPEHGPAFAGPPEPRQFSFNSRHGACPRCDGLGTVQQWSKNLLFPRTSLSFWEALDGRAAGVLRRSPKKAALLSAALAALGADGPVSSWSKSTLKAVMSGTSAPISVRWTQVWGNMRREVEETAPWPGLEALLGDSQTDLSALKEMGVCPECEGSRLAPAPRAVRFAGWTLPAFSALTLAEARALTLTWKLEGAAAAVGERPLGELRRRLGFLVDLGLGYLTLDRAHATLSGGEAQRIRLASLLGAGLVGVIYVLDEPTVGLHPRDTDRLLSTLESLRDLGNTVLLVEHDPDTLRRADYLIDLGPGAGAAGGTLVAAGTPAQLAAHPTSLTGAWLSGRAALPPRAQVRQPKGWFTLTNPALHNLKGGTVRVPAGVWVGVSGVSGSGKSSLAMHTLHDALARHLGDSSARPLLDAFHTDPTVSRVIRVDQTPLSRSPRSTPASYTGILDTLRALFAATRGAQERGFGVGRFSYNSPSGGGRCPVCEGRGAALIEMHFLPDVWIPCEACKGARYNRETLAVRWSGINIAEVLSLTAAAALERLGHYPALKRSLQSLVDVGLGYLSLGQPLNTLSGGEAQRVKLAAELVSRKGHAVYLLDEPTTGLHMSDVAQLVAVLHRLVERGHTVITVEHHLGLLDQCDYLLELGPEGGDAGGYIIASGAPQALAALPTPTGRALAAWRGATP